MKNLVLIVFAAFFIGCGSGSGGGDSTPETPENTVIINEVLASNKTGLQDPKYNKYSDWIELYNSSTNDVDLSGYGLSNSKKSFSWKFPQGSTIGADSYLLIWADDKNSTTSLHTDFKLSKDGDNVVLFDKTGEILQNLEFKEQYSDVSYANDGTDHYIKTVVPTPERKNEIFEALKSEKPTVDIKGGNYPQELTITLSAAAGAKIYYELDSKKVTTLSDLYTKPIKLYKYTELRAAALEIEQGKMLSKELSETYVFQKEVQINEILADNKSVNSDEDGNFGDWIELYNNSYSNIKLDGYGLSTSKKAPSWYFPVNTYIGAHSYLLIWADDKNSSLHTDFKLKAKDDKVVLFDNSGDIIDLVEFKNQYTDYSYAKDINNTFQKTYIVTPAKANTIGAVVKSQKPDFTPDGGTYTRLPTLILSTQNPSDIYYTTDGKSADEKSTKYTAPIALNSYTEVNAVAKEMKDGYVLSSNETEYYVLNHGLYIEEVLAKNDTINTDPDFDEYGDWVKLHNSNSSDVDISSYALSKSRGGRRDCRHPLPEGRQPRCGSDNSGI
jgi:hypothetical protein